MQAGIMGELVKVIGAIQSPQLYWQLYHTYSHHSPDIARKFCETPHCSSHPELVAAGAKR